MFYLISEMFGISHLYRCGIPKEVENLNLTVRDDTSGLNNQGEIHHAFSDLLSQPRSLNTLCLNIGGVGMSGLDWSDDIFRHPKLSFWIHTFVMICNEVREAKRLKASQGLKVMHVNFIQGHAVWEFLATAADSDIAPFYKELQNLAEVFGEEGIEFTWNRPRSCEV